MEHISNAMTLGLVFTCLQMKISFEAFLDNKTPPEACNGHDFEK